MLAFVVALAIGVAAHTASASASTLCAIGPSQAICPGTSLMPAGAMLVGSNLGPVVISTALASRTCTGSTYGLGVTANPGVRGNLTALNFTNCHDQFNVSCALTPNGLPLPMSFASSSASTAAVNGTRTISNSSFTLTGSCIVAGCTYTAASISGSVYNPDSTVKPSASSHMVVKFNSVALNSGCGTMTLTFTWDVTKTRYPTGGDVWLDQS